MSVATAKADADSAEHVSDHEPAYRRYELRDEFLRSVFNYLRKNPGKLKGAKIYAVTLTYPPTWRDPSGMIPALAMFLRRLRRVPPPEDTERKDRRWKHMMHPCIWVMADFSKKEALHWHGFVVVWGWVTPYDIKHAWVCSSGATDRATSVKYVKEQHHVKSDPDVFEENLCRAGLYYSKSGRTVTMPFYLSVVATGRLKKIWRKVTGRAPLPLDFAPVEPRVGSWELLLGTSPQSKARRGDRPCKRPGCTGIIPASDHPGKWYCRTECKTAMERERRRASRDGEAIDTLLDKSERQDT